MPFTPEELALEQERLASLDVEDWSLPDAPPARLRIGGCLAISERGIQGSGAAGDRCWASAAVVDITTGALVGHSVIEARTGWPYEPGMLFLRIGPALLDAVRALDVTPDVLLVDATGRDHPRSAGMALHLGALLDLPTVGVTHRPLIASGEWPDEAVGSASKLTIDRQLVGYWLRTRRSLRPIAVHAAWRTSPATALQVVRACVRERRTPEPLRQARRLARAARSGVL